MFLRFLDRFRNTLTDTSVAAAWSLGSSLFWAIFLWGFWGREVMALGLNATVYLCLTLGLFFWLMRRRGVNLKKNLYWIVPLLLVSLSFSLYSNPFAKATSILVLPVALAVFCGLSYRTTEKDMAFSLSFVINSIFRLFTPLAKLGEALKAHLSVRQTVGKKAGLIRRVATGFLLLAALTLTVVIPLLSSADPQFAAFAKIFTEWVGDLLEVTIILKIAFACLLSLFTVAALLAWSREPAKATEDERPVDSVVAGIVLSGTLAVYLLFIALQAKRVLVGQLPIDFTSTVQLVKSGFWQLIFLSVLNIVIFVTTYRKTSPAVQRVLTAFTASSLFLLASAGQRMALYVTYYGFSFEKFYASLTVVYCAVLFAWLVTRLLRGRRADVVRFATVLFLWMYAAAVVFPVEQFTMRFNLALAERPDSRIRLYELTMLSPDVRGLVADKIADGTFQKNELATNPNQTSAMQINEAWARWLELSDATARTKTWYEMNLSDVTNNR